MTHKNENGRSMVEMLGVLAIIGVLSIATIGSFRYAMDLIRINTLKSWLTGMEFAVLENCFFNQNNDCQGSTREAYIRRRSILCKSMGDNYCSTQTGIYVPLKFFPDIKWSTSLDSLDENKWSVTLTQLNEHQCEKLFNMTLPKSVYRINTNNFSVTFTNRQPILTTAEKTRLISFCRNGVKHDASYAGIFTLSFYAQ